MAASRFSLFLAGVFVAKRLRKAELRTALPGFAGDACEAAAGSVLAFALSGSSRSFSKLGLASRRKSRRARGRKVLDTT